MPCQALAVEQAGRPNPESVNRIGRPTCTRMCTLTCHLARSTERSTDCKYPILGWGRSTVRLGTIDWAVDRPKSNCCLDWHGRPGGRPAGSTVNFLTVGRSTGRSTGRPIWAFSLPTGRFQVGALYTPFEVAFCQDFQEQNFSYSLVF